MALIVIDESQYEIREKDIYDKKPSDDEIYLSGNIMSRIQNGIYTPVEQVIIPASHFMESSLPIYTNMIPTIIEDTSSIMDNIMVESPFNKVGRFFKGVANFFIGSDENT